MGVLIATGNRGSSGSRRSRPIDLTMLYWITSQLALGIEGSQATDSFSSSGVSGGRVNVGSPIWSSTRGFTPICIRSRPRSALSPLSGHRRRAYLESESAVDGDSWRPRIPSSACPWARASSSRSFPRASPLKSWAAGTRSTQGHLCAAVAAQRASESLGAALQRPTGACPSCFRRGTR